MKLHVALSLLLISLYLFLPMVLAAQDVAESRAELKKQLDPLFDEEQFENAFWGIRVETLDGDVVFDRNGYIYHGRVKAVSSGAREEGLEF